MERNAPFLILPGALRYRFSCRVRYKFHVGDSRKQHPTSTILDFANTRLCWVSLSFYPTYLILHKPVPALKR
ncbi:MAG: hypothetical protein F6K40_18715 [Okeania sp. SIO3I5]|uniref:hypothetical protein n=1 Tax=Okeania sp. SIO3I5 TaxID=2607805 RepID=UPI0013B6F95A|nr:hypothetical protein [Okeania sp. SIO3I5]NEQ38183.1 hypothetical protein [Okeania sp. SIO3I5]